MVKNYRDQAYLDKLGQRIVAIRRLKNITQEKLAELCDLDVRTIGRIERAETNATISILKLIADAFKIKASELFDFE